MESWTATVTGESHDVGPFGNGEDPTGTVHWLGYETGNYSGLGFSCTENLAAKVQAQPGPNTGCEGFVECGTEVFRVVLFDYTMCTSASPGCGAEVILTVSPCKLIFKTLCKAGARLVGKATGKVTAKLANKITKPTTKAAPNTTTVYRVESPGNARLDISPAGDVAIKGDNALFLNFGDEARAISTQTSRLESGYDGTVVKAFDVPTSYVDELRAASVPESLAGSYPNAPFRVDTRYVDQFGLRSCSFAGLADAIVPGSGRVC